MISSKFYYLLSLILVFVIPSVIVGIFIWEKIFWLNFAAFIIIITIIGSIWDIWATRHGKKDSVWLWQFNNKDTLNIKIIGLPIEEYLFYVCSSLYVVFIWKAIELALETRNLIFFLIVPCMGIWSLIFILIPYKLRTKSDRLSWF